MGALILPAHHAPFAEKFRFLQNAIGTVPSAYDSWLAQHGAKTLHLHMKSTWAECACSRSCPSAPRTLHKSSTPNLLHTHDTPLPSVRYRHMRKNSSRLGSSGLTASDADFLNGGIGKNPIRLSVGVEEEDLVRGVETALELMTMRHFSATGTLICST